MTATDMYGACVARMALLIERAMIKARAHGTPDHVRVAFHAGVVLPLPETVDGVPVRLGTAQRIHEDYFVVDVVDAGGSVLGDDYLQTHEITMLLS